MKREDNEQISYIISFAYEITMHLAYMHLMVKSIATNMPDILAMQRTSAGKVPKRNKQYIPTIFSRILLQNLSRSQLVVVFEMSNHRSYRCMFERGQSKSLSLQPIGNLFLISIPHNSSILIHHQILSMTSRYGGCAG